ncbi:ATP-dependent RecD-like DNA helicase [Pasteurella multocida]
MHVTETQQVPIYEKKMRYVLGSEIDQKNEQVMRAYNAVKNTNRNVLITGGAGTGKTNLLKYIVNNVKNKNIAVVSFTAMAAINAGGQTIHSFFNIDPDHIFKPDDPKLNRDIHSQFKYSTDHEALLRELDVLIIDEISTVRVDVVMVIDRLLKFFRRPKGAMPKDDLPFGGLQIVMIGDPFQLPPVVTNDEKGVLFNEIYQGKKYFFESDAYIKGDFTHITLTKGYRQDNDNSFRCILNRFRTLDYKNTRHTLESDIHHINNWCSKKADEGSIKMFPTNRERDDYNDSMLKQLSGGLPRLYEAKHDEDWNVGDPAPRNLLLKVGARVMFVKNDKNRMYYNGLCGVVSELGEDHITVKTDDGHTILLRRECWHRFEYYHDKSKNTVDKQPKGFFKQFPITLAWGLTIHKSQGLTLEKASIHPERAFAEGQIYVALSRCRRLRDVHLQTPLLREHILVCPRVQYFMENGFPNLVGLNDSTPTANMEVNDAPATPLGKENQIQEKNFVEASKYERLLSEFNELKEGMQDIVNFIINSERGFPKYLEPYRSEILKALNAKQEKKVSQKHNPIDNNGATKHNARREFDALSLILEYKTLNEQATKKGLKILKRLQEEMHKKEIYINRLLQENSALLSIPGVMEALAKKEKRDEEEAEQMREASRQSSDVSGMSTWFQDD